MTHERPVAAGEELAQPAGEKLVQPPAGEPRMAIPLREAAAVCGLLLLLLAAAYCNVVFGGRSLVYSDNYNPLDYRMFEQTQGPDFLPAEVWTSRNLSTYANFHDAGATWWQWEPGGEFLRRGLRRGELPWWDPYVGGGVPAMANLTPAFFFPPSLVLVALGNGVALKNVYFLTVLLSAAFFSYLLLRRHHLSREASFAAAVAVLFCGGLNQNVGSFMGQTAACLPPALLLTRWFLDRPSWCRAALLAAGYAAMALASFPPLLFAAFGLSGLYATVLIAAGEDRARQAGRYLAAVALSLGLVGFYYLPAFAVMRATPQVTAHYQGASVTFLPWYQFSQLLSPVLMGGGKVFVSPPMPDIGGLGITLPYLGVVAMLIAGLAGRVGPRHTRLFFVVVATAAALIVLKLAGIEPVQSLTRLPVLRTIHFAHYFGIPLNILLGFAAGIGLERLLRGKVSRTRVWVVILGMGIVLLGMLTVALVRGTFAHSQAAAWLTRWYLAMALLVVTSAVLLTLAGAREPSVKRRRLCAAAIVALLAVEGVINTYYPRQDRWNIWKHPVPYVQKLLARRDAGRIYGAGAFHPNAASVFELFQVDSMMTFNPPRMLELYKSYAAPGAYLFLSEASLLPPDGVLDAANVGLLAIREVDRSALAVEAAKRGYREFFADGYVRLFERATPPRYYFTSRYRRLPREKILPALAEVRADREVLVEQPPAFPSVPNDGREPPVVVEELSRNRVTLRVHAPRPGLVYCSESFFPGWRATVNGRPAPILAANYAFRAVRVPAGDLVVELSYFPPGLLPGLVASLAAALIVLALIGTALWRDRKRTPGAGPSVQSASDWELRKSGR